MSALRITLLSIVLNALAVPSSTTLLSAQLHGTVKDINEALIRDATVLVTSEDGGTQRTTTDENGNYRLELSNGTYRISVAAIGFCPSRRASFRINSSTAATFNFTLMPCAISNDLKIVNGEYVSETDRYRNPFKDEAFPIKQTEGPPLELMIQFVQRRKVGKFLEYEGAYVSYDEYAQTPAGYVRRKKLMGVTATYDLVMIKADKLRFDRRTNRVEAIGNVVFDDGKQQITGHRMEASFSRGKLIANRLK